MKVRNPNPVKVRAGQIGARARWGDEGPGVVRLDGRSVEQRRQVIALVERLREEGTP